MQLKCIRSNPISLANGSKKFAIYSNKEISCIPIFAKSQITIPVGAAIETALPKTKSVLSKIERTIIFPIWGFLYGGNSKVKLEGIPFKTVCDNIFEMTNVIKIPSKITSKTVRVDKIDAPKPIPNPPIKIVAIVIKKGNLPLQGTNAFVSIAINFSRGEFIILQPTTPAALHPKSHAHSQSLFPRSRTFFKTIV